MRCGRHQHRGNPRNVGVCRPALRNQANLQRYGTRYLLLVLAVVLSACVAACGGGSSSDANPPRENAAPTFSGAAEFTFGEGAEFRIPVNVTDPDGDSLTVRLLDSADGRFFVLTVTNEVFAGKILDYENPEDGNGDNVYAFELSVTDGQLSATRQFEVTVTDRPGRGFLGERGASAVLGTSEFSAAGTSVVAVGDVDGDAAPDLVVGAPRFQSDVGRPGLVHFISGAALADSGNGLVVLSDSATAGAVRLEGSVAAEPFGELGIAVTALNDLDGDGLSEVAVSSIQWHFSRGAVFVIRSAAIRAALIGSNTISIEALVNDGNGARIDGSDTNDAAGFRLSSVRDIDGDDLDELLVCAPEAGTLSEFRGVTYVVMGAAVAAAFNDGALDLDASVAAGGSIRLVGSDPFASSCAEVDDAGDFDGDGLTDLVVGEPRRSGDTGSRAHVVSGAAVLAALADSGTLLLNELETSSAGVTVVYENNLDNFAFSVSAAGDFNNDGFDDVMIGVPNRDVVDQSEGAVYVLFGTAAAFAAPVAFDQIAASNLGVEIFGGARDDGAGYSLAALGDLNGDGFDDIAIAAPDAALAREGENEFFIRNGKIYIVFGAAQFAGNRIRFADSFDGVTVWGINPETRFGSSLSAFRGTSDVDGDSLPDLLVGVPGAELCDIVQGGDIRNTGAALVISGRRLLDAATADRILDLVEILPHLKRWSPSACNKPGLDWIRQQ